MANRNYEKRKTEVQATSCNKKRWFQNRKSNNLIFDLANDVSVSLTVSVFGKTETETKVVAIRQEEDIKPSIIRKPANATGSTAPTISMVLPESGPSNGVYQVALFGINFVPRHSQFFLIFLFFQL
jgi:hypothetical protein